MTREEAKYTLLHIYEQCAWGSECEEYGCSVCEDALNMAIEALQAEPVKHGEWINKRLTKDSIKDIKDGTYGELIGYHDICSVCGFDIDEFWYATGSPDYCPNCGADMRKKGGEDHETD